MFFFCHAAAQLCSLGSTFFLFTLVSAIGPQQIISECGAAVHVRTWPSVRPVMKGSAAFNVAALVFWLSSRRMFFSVMSLLSCASGEASSFRSHLIVIGPQ